MFIWIDREGKGRNRYALFRHSFDLRATPKTGKLNIFADTRYRLLVNGSIVGHGPTRFYPVHPEYDSYDLTPHLRRGRNVIAVVVNSYGMPCFHAAKSRGGLIAWGEIRDVRGRRQHIETGPDWRAVESPGHRLTAGRLSFALNPGELLDAGKMPVGWELPEFDDSKWPAAVPLTNQKHWGRLRRRSIPLLDESEMKPVGLTGSWKGQGMADEDLFSIAMSVPEEFLEPPLGGSREIRMAAMLRTRIYSPRAQTVRFSATVGDCWLNGQPLKGELATYNWLRFEFEAGLQAGWNTLFLKDQPPRDVWEFYLGLPRQAGLRLDDPPFWVAGPWGGALAEEADKLTVPLTESQDLPASFGPWRVMSSACRAESAHIERSWQKFSEGDTVRLYDFGTEVLGRPVLEFTAKAGTRVDLHYFDRLTKDGRGQPDANPSVRLSERYIARAGQQVYRAFHPRGFRYLEINLGDRAGGFTLHEVGLTRASYPVRREGRFRCSDERLNRIWDLGRDTQIACMEDAFLDCPQRERGLYSGDLLVQFYVNLAAFGDTKLMRRCIEVFLEGQDEEGWVPAGAHGLWAKRHPDYTAIMVQNLWQYYGRTGDRPFLRACAPHTRNIVAALQLLERPGTDLIDGLDRTPYLDLAQTDHEGVCCALNCFRYQALVDAANILQVAGDRTTAQQYRRKATAVAAAIRRGFWDDERGLFVDRLKSDRPDTSPSVHGNTLPLLWGIANAKQTRLALPFILDAIRNNFRVENPQNNGDMNVNAYFSFYVLGLLYRHGLAVEALDFIRAQWGRMIDGGAWTAWEYFIDMASRCHAWACSPTHYLSSEVLGVQFPVPGNPNRVRIAPQPGRLEWAEGVYPHPKGGIQVSWKRQDGRLVLDYKAPKGVQVERAKRR